MCCHCAIGEIWPFSIVVCEIAVIRFMVKTVLPVLKADFPSASRLSFFGFRTSLKAHSRRTCMGPEKIGSDCSCERHHGKERVNLTLRAWRHSRPLTIFDTANFLISLRLVTSWFLFLYSCAKSCFPYFQDTIFQICALEKTYYNN